MHPAPPSTREYDIEIGELARQIARLEREEADPELIRELEREHEVLIALLQAALRLWDQGEADPDIRLRFEAAWEGPWEFPEVYSMVYEHVVGMDLGGDHHGFLRGIRKLDPVTIF